MVDCSVRQLEPFLLAWMPDVMSYEEPTSADREALVDFYDRLDASFGRQSNHDTTLDLLKTDFDWYMQPADHTTWSAPYPPFSRDTYREWSVSERIEQLQQAALENIQKRMDDATLLSHIHGVELANIDGLEQSPSVIRQQIQQERTGNQALMCDY